MVVAGTFSNAISAFSFTEFLPSHLAIYEEGEFELLAKRRAAFLAVVSREDLDGNIVENYQIRSKHFVTGKPSNTLDKK